MSSFQFSFRPRLVDDLKNYNRSYFFRDIAAGLTVGVVALPLAMAFAIASGVKPEAGIFTAIIAGFLISALGGSRVQIGGPAGAFIVIVYGILEKYGLANLLIAVSQMKDFFGLNIAKMPGDFFAQINILARSVHLLDLTTLALALISLVLVFLWPNLVKVRMNDILHEQENKNLRSQIWKKNTNKAFSFLSTIPGPVVVLVFGAIAVSAFHLPVETIGSKFGGIPQSLPTFTLPVFSWSLVKQLFAPTITIALLGAIESLLCARVADKLTGDRHDPNQELMAQGIANIVVPFFGGLPATGTIARTVTNIRSGAVSPVAGMVHAITILVTVLVAAPLAKNIPLASLAAILLIVAFNMGEWREFVRLKQFSINYRVIMLGTFFLTVIIDLTVAVEAGLMLACIFFIYRISSLTTVEPIPATRLGAPLPIGVVAYSIFGSLFFGAVDKLEQLIDPKTMMARVMILELDHLINIDTTGLDALEMLLKLIQKQGGQLVLCGLNQQPLSLMQRSGFYARVGVENCVESLPMAIKRAGDIVH